MRSALKGKAVRKRKRARSHYEELWLAAGALLANAEDPKFVQTATAMCGKKELARLYRVWKKADF